MAPTNAKPTFSYDHFSKKQLDFMTSVTSHPALAILEQCGVLNDSREVLLHDGAAGNALVTTMLKERLPETSKVKVIMGELGEGLVTQAQERIETEGWKDVEARVVDAQCLPFDDATFDYLLVNCGFQLFPDIGKAFSEASRALKHDGVLAYSAGVDMAVFRLLNSVDPSFPIPFIFDLPIAKAAETPAFLAAHGFKDVEVKPVKFEQRFDSAEECVETLKVGMKALFADEERNGKVFELLKEQQGDGEVVLDWNWISVTARKA